MALPTFSEFKNGSGNIGSSKLPSFSEFQKTSPITQKRNEVQAERADRISKGEAVSVNKNKAKPTFGGQILRGIAKPAATLIARPAQAVAAAKGFTEDEQTFKSKYLGDIKTSKNTKDVVKDVGRGLEVISNGVGIGALKTAGANVARQGVLQVAKRAAVEGMAAGAIQGIGSGVSEGKTGKDLLWSAAKSTAMGGAGGFVLGGALSKIMGTPKSLEELATAKAPYKIPAAGVAPEGYINQNQFLKLNAPKEQLSLPGKGQTRRPDWYVGEGGVSKDPKLARTGNKLTPEQIERNTKVQYEPYIPEDKLPVITAKPNIRPAKNEYNASLKYDPETGTPVKAAKSNPLKTIVDNSSNKEKKYYTNSYGKRIEIKEDAISTKTVSNGVGTKGSNVTTKSETPTVAQDKTITPKGTVVPKVTVGAPQMASKVEKAKTALRSAYRESPEQLTGGNLDEIATKSATLIELDKDRALRIALGKELPRAEDGVTSDAVYRVLSADADGELAVKLANSTVPSTSGIKLATNKLGDRGGIVDTIREANTTLKKNMDPKAAKKAVTELADEIRANKPTLEELKKLIDEFDICK